MNLDFLTDLGDWTYLIVGLLAFGETGAFIGLFLPGELAVIFGGVVAGQGAISLPLMLAVAWLAAFLGDSTGFSIGRRYGRRFLLRRGSRFGITPERLGRVERYFAHHGGKTIIVGRFLSLVRPLAPLFAGASGMRYREFAPYSVLGTGIWAATFVLLGYFGSRSVEQALELARRGSFVFGSLVALVVGIALMARFLRLPENRRRAVEWIERRRALRPLLGFARRFRRPARFAWNRLTPGRLGLELTTLLAVLAVGLFALVSYTWIFAGDTSPTGGDQTALDFARDVEAGWLTAIAKAVTQLGSTYVVLPLALIAATVLAGRRHWPELWVLVGGMALIVFANGDLKHAIERLRPADGLVAVHGYAFPSGHAAYSVLYVWLGATLSVRLHSGLPRGTALVTAGAIIAALVGLSRVYLRVHYLSDVTAGWALGASAFALCGVAALLFTYLRENARQ
jgi:undecaprenyl-diphosphatase